MTVLQPDEVGIVRRLGSVVAEPWEPGLHWGFPWGFDRVDRIKVNQTRTIAVGAPAGRVLRCPGRPTRLPTIS